MDNFYRSPSPLQPCWRPTCCLCCSPPASSSKLRLCFAWAPPEATGCLCLTTLSLHQHCGRFLSLSQALLSSARGPPLACAALVAPAGPSNYDFFFLPHQLVCDIFYYLLCLFTPCVQHSAGCFAAGCALVSWLHQGWVEALVSYSSAGVSLGEYTPAKGYTVQCVSSCTVT